MLKINITEEKPNRFEQAANILGRKEFFQYSGLYHVKGIFEVDEAFYARLEADIAAVGDGVAKDWLRAYGVGEEAKKIRHLDVKLKHEGDVLKEHTQALNCNKVWAHKNSGNRYDVIAITNTAATKEGIPLTVAFTRDGVVWSSPVSEFFEEFRVASSPSEEGRESTLDEDSVLSALYEKLKADGHWSLFEHVAHAGAAGVRSCTPITASVPKHPLQEVFDAVIAQVTTGKGQRHGGGEQPFFEQPWFTTTQQVGIGFPLGQAMKKLGESSSKPDAESFETELLGAIAYAAMAYLANKKLAGKSQTL